MGFNSGFKGLKPGSKPVCVMAVHSIGCTFFTNLTQEIETEASICLSSIQNYASEYTLLAAVGTAWPLLG